MVEVWKAIPDFPGYEASSRGRVRSVDRTVTRDCRWGGKSTAYLRGRMLALAPNSHGYLVVSLCDGEVKITRTVHVLIAEIFLGERPDGMMVCHRDGVRDNCKANNLYYGTGKDNAADSARHGTLLRGEDKPSAKLTDAAVMKIRAARGKSQRELGEAFGVSQSTIGTVRRGEKWSHIR